MSKRALKSKVMSGRLPAEEYRKLRSFFPKKATDNEIVVKLAREKLARAKFDEWIESLQKSFDETDFDLGSIK